MSLIRKFFSRDIKPSSESYYGGIQFLRPELQKRFSHGVKYNMKLVIRGNRKSGKTALFNRLKGEPFDPVYRPTDEIQVACIVWSPINTEEVVKVDVWDVVDKGKPRSSPQASKSTDSSRVLAKEEPPSDAHLDATFLDVYKGTVGAFFVYDCRDPDSFEYVSRELSFVPYHMSVLIIANFRDLQSDTSVTLLEVKDLINDTLKARKELATRMGESEKAGPIRFCEASMLHGFGLHYIHRFLNLPLLALQRASLFRLLAENRDALLAIQSQLDTAEAGPICHYDTFIERLSQGESMGDSVATLSTDNSKRSHPEVISKDNIQSSSSCNANTPVLEYNQNSKSVSNESPILNHNLQGDTRSLLASIPVVSAVQEEIDPVDVLTFVATRDLPSSQGENESDDSLTADDDDDDEDDDDATDEEEDYDDDEEQLGPGLGLRIDPHIGHDLSPSLESCPVMPSKNFEISNLVRKDRFLPQKLRFANQPGLDTSIEDRTSLEEFLNSPS